MSQQVTNSGPELCLTQNRGFVSQEGRVMSPLAATQNLGTVHKRFTLREPLLLCRWKDGGMPPPLRHNTTVLCHRWAPPPPSPRPFPCPVTQQTCLLCRTADMSAVSHSRHVRWSHSRHVCCAAQHACLLCHTAGTSVTSHSRPF